MAANQHAMRQMFQRLGFPEAAARMIVSSQGYDELEELVMLTDEGVTKLCKHVTKSGGMVANPDHLDDEDNVVDGEPAQIMNPAKEIPFKAQQDLMLAIYWIKHQKRTSRLLVPANLTREAVRKLKERREYETKRHVDGKPTDDIIQTSDWPKTFESLDALLRSMLGSTGLPLAYVVRKSEAVVPDPAEGYNDLIFEMIARGPIGVQGNRPESFVEDNHKVWDVIAELIRHKECWTYVIFAEIDRDGRAAYWGLRNHFLGLNEVDQAANKAEDILHTTHYHGETKRFTFEKFITKQREQHHILNNLKAHGHSGIDGRSKVRYLLNGLKCPSLLIPTSTILNDASRRVDYDGCVILYKDYITTTKPKLGASMSVASLATGQSREGRKRGGGGGQVELRRYSPDEYKKLSKEQKKKLNEMRKDARAQKASKQRSKKQKCQNDEESRVVAEVEHDAATEPADNRTNPALTRQRRS